jgi:hypothetical protein
MYRRLLCVTIASTLTIVGPAGIAKADLLFGLSSPSSHIAFNDQGNLVLEGHCFGNVGALPSGVTISWANGKVGMKDGNLYSTEWIVPYYVDPSIPGSIRIMKDSALVGVVNSSSGRVYLKGGCVNVNGCSNTRWDPYTWNDADRVPFGTGRQYHANCYSYANDMNLGESHPGYAVSDSARASTVEAWRAAALRDGLRWVGWEFPGNTYDCGNGHLMHMGLSGTPDRVSADHFWRLDQENGRWSHKTLGGPARNTDFSGAPILNPLLANRASYTVNGGFYCTCGGGWGRTNW